MGTNNSNRGKIARVLSTLMLAGIVTVGLAACGTSASTDINPTATTAMTADSAPTTAEAAMPTATAVMMIDLTPTPVSAAMSTDTTPTTDAMAMEIPTTGSSDAMGAATPTTAVSSSNGSAAQINATLREWALDLSQTQVPAGKVTFTVTNAGQMGHNLTVISSSGNQIGKTPVFRSTDGPQTLEVQLAPGTYDIICSLPGHAARGQRNTLVVK